MVMDRRRDAGQRLRIEEPLTTNLLAKIEAAPWPYFPVDLLPVLIALAVRAEGAMQFWNKIYEGGFTWLPELAKFGAHAVTCDPHRIIVFGNRPLRPAVVEAPYIIRAAVALYAVAASIPGQSVVKNADAIRRAHPRFVENLRALGAIGDKSAVDPLIEALDPSAGTSGDPRDKNANNSNEAFAEVLGNLGEKKACTKLLEAMKKSRHDFTVLKAISARTTSGALRFCAVADHVYGVGDDIARAAVVNPGLAVSG